MFYDRKNEVFKVPEYWVAEHRIQVVKDALEIAEKFLLQERAKEIISVIPEEFDLAA